MPTASTSSAVVNPDSAPSPPTSSNRVNTENTGPPPSPTGTTPSNPTTSTTSTTSNASTNGVGKRNTAVVEPQPEAHTHPKSSSPSTPAVPVFLPLSTRLSAFKNTHPFVVRGSEFRDDNPPPFDDPEIVREMKSLNIRPSVPHTEVPDAVGPMRTTTTATLHHTSLPARARLRLLDFFSPPTFNLNLNLNFPLQLLLFYLNMSTNASSSSQPLSQAPAPATAADSPRANSLLLAAFPWDTDSLTEPVLADVFQGSSTLDKLLKHFGNSMDMFEKRFGAHRITGDSGLRQLLRIEGPDMETGEPAARNTVVAYKKGKKPVKVNNDLAILVCSYRVLDVAAWLLGRQSTILVPQHPKLPLPKLSFRRLSLVNDCRSILLDARANFRSQDTLQTPYATNNIHLSTLKFLCNVEANSGSLQTLWNLQLAAMHLRHLLTMEYTPDSYSIPDVPNDLNDLFFPSEEVSSSLTPAEKAIFTKLAEDYKHAGFRLSLQIALLVSPIMLLSDLKLCSLSWDKAEMIGFSKALGNQKPEIIKRIERMIWLTLFGIAEGSTQPYLAMQYLATTLPWSDIENMTDSEIEWFKPDQNLKTALPSTSEVTIVGPISETWPMASVLRPLLPGLIASSSQQGPSGNPDGEEDGEGDSAGAGAGAGSGAASGAASGSGLGAPAPEPEDTTGDAPAAPADQSAPGTQDPLEEQETDGNEPAAPADPPASNTEDLVRGHCCAWQKQVLTLWVRVTT
ncbi:hypothetical protein GALMADRAFT_146663 [Galerina marginata CBS 339.88]|uniref:Uncharacterized protein n=1 Tax=Galerina marginata (strain CBS 339.88) TaxID=685588 RepID=A0A067SAL7_GALM3|nr:hypothetical protein GALMADRAFT_146663 [Galerina marginata CBS 339.88]